MFLHPANIVFEAATEAAAIGLNRMVDYYRKHYGEDRDSYKLKKLLTVAKIVRDYAEHKRFENKEAVQTLQDALKNEINDVENVLEEFSAEQVLKETLEAESGIITEELRSLLPARKNPISLLGNDKIKSKIEVIAQKMDELANKINVLRLEGAAAGSSTTGIQTSSVPQNSGTLTVDNSRLRISTGTNLKAFGKWLFVINNILFEILVSVFDQVSSPNRPGYAVAGLVMSLVVVAVCVTEFLWKARKENVTMRRQGLIWWFYYPPPRDKLYGTLADNFGIICAFLQDIFSGIQYDFFHRNADYPINFSTFPVIFAMCLTWSKLIHNPNELPRESQPELEKINVE